MVTLHFKLIYHYYYNMYSCTYHSLSHVVTTMECNLEPSGLRVGRKPLILLQPFPNPQPVLGVESGLELPERFCGGWKMSRDYQKLQIDLSSHK